MELVLMPHFTGSLDGDKILDFGVKDFAYGQTLGELVDVLSGHYNGAHVEGLAKKTMDPGSGWAFSTEKEAVKTEENLKQKTDLDKLTCGEQKKRRTNKIKNTGQVKNCSGAVKCLFWWRVHKCFKIWKLRKEDPKCATGNAT